MNLQEIKQAIADGKKVHWSNKLYDVIESKWEYLIRCNSNGHCIGLTWQDGVTMNGREEDFFIGE